MSNEAWGSKFILKVRAEWSKLNSILIIKVEAMKEEYNRQHSDSQIQIDLVDEGEDSDDCDGTDWQLHSQYCPRKVRF